MFIKQIKCCFIVQFFILIVCLNMSYSKKEIDQINDYCERRLSFWRKNISSTIVGVHFGKKKIESKNKLTKRNAIVFHIEQKFAYPHKKIPSEIIVKFKNGKSKKLPTDVIETGITKLTLIKPGDKASVKGQTNIYGASGFFFTKNEHMYVCSNMHVLAPQHLANGYYYRPINQQLTLNVVCHNNSSMIYGYLEEASFRGIDIAIARIPSSTAVDTSVRNIGLANGVVSENLIRRDLDIRFFSPVRERLIKGKVAESYVTKIVRYGDITVQLNNLIQTSLPAVGGDSGSFVFDSFNRIVGMVVSIDEYFTYLIRISNIQKFINQNIA